MNKLAVITLLLILSGIQVAYACYCRDTLFEDRIEISDFIFIGKVLAAERVYSDSSLISPVRQNFTLEVLKRYKGNDIDTLVVDMAINSCSYFFETDKTYLVFAVHKTGDSADITSEFLNANRYIVTGGCSGNEVLKKASSEIELLDALYPAHDSPKLIPAEKLYGKIWRNGVFDFFTQDPEFPGGRDSLSAYIRSNLQPCTLQLRKPMYDYHADTLENRLDEKSNRHPPAIVMVHFEISVAGELSQFEVSRFFSLGEECDTEALRVARLMPRWDPGRIRGIPVRSDYYVDIYFDFPED